MLQAATERESSDGSQSGSGDILGPGPECRLAYDDGGV